MVRRRAAAGALSLLVLAGCSSRGAPSGASPTPSVSSVSGSSATAVSSAGHGSAVQWQPCSGSAGPKGFQCATIQVPRDPRHPAVGGTIAMALDRHPATGQKVGSLLVNPGGPGASGVDFLPQAVAMLTSTVTQHFDIVGFDPPGVARTAPIRCLGSAGMESWFSMDPDPPTEAGLQAELAQDRSFAQGCEKNSGAELPYVSTVDAAMDMDVIRQDLGDAKLTYLGFSYGTFLGATYAGLYPDKVRAMVLDGALDPSLGVVQGIDEQSEAFYADLQAALRGCATNSKCPWQPAGDPVAAFEALMARVRSNPLPVSGTKRTVGPAQLLYGTAVTLYSTSSWTDLYTALAQASKGDGTAFLQLFDIYTGRQSDGSYSNEFEANTAISCLDAPAPSTAAVEAAARAASTRAPIFGPADVYSELNCDVWPVPASGTPAPIHAVGSPPIVVVGTTGDPATPYREAQSLASQLQHGVLLTRVGEGHTAYPYSSCIRGYVDSYLVDLTVPPAGQRCPSN